MSTSEEEEDITTLQKNIKELTSELLNSKEELLSLTGKENDVPEKAIKDAYLAIIRGVDFWIDDVSGHRDFTFRPKWQDHLQSSRRKEALEDLGLNSRCHDITWQKKLGEKPYAHYTILSLAILKVINNEILSRPRYTFIPGSIYPFSLSGKHIRLVEDLQQVMSEELGRDETQILRWRGETILAMNAQQEPRERQRDQADEILKRLTKGLEEWLDHRVLQDRRKTLQQMVIDPAIKFARMAGCAHKKYILEVENFVGSPVPNGSSWSIRDVSNWRDITPTDARGVFHCLWPMLVRKGIGNQTDNQLVQPIMIGFLADADLDLPEAPPSVALRDSARSTKQRSEEPARSRKSSPSKKPSSAKHGGRPAEKESWIRNFMPTALTSSSSKSKDNRALRRPSEGVKHPTLQLNAEQDTRRASVGSNEGVVDFSYAHPTEEWHGQHDQDEDHRWS